MTSKVKQQQLEWRRSQVLELSSMGYGQREIARKLQIDLAAVNRDIHFLRRCANESMRTHIQERIPSEYQKCLLGLNQVLKMGWDIVNNDATTSSNRLQALALISDSYRHLMDLTTNGVVITDAIKYVQGKMDHLNNQEKKLLQDIEQEQDKREK